MAESMKGLHRSHRCAEVVNAAIGSEVTVMGWVQKRRNLGGMIFIDLRDRSGLLQIVFDENDIGTEGYEKAGKLRSEFVIAVTGKLEKRGGAVNDNLATGELEVRAESLRILSESETPPFPIEEHIQTRDELRLKYRYLDLRRPNLQRNLLLRSKVATAIRRFMQETTSYQAVYIRAASMHCRSHRSCSNSCLCVPDTTAISRSQNVSVTRT